MHGGWIRIICSLEGRIRILLKSNRILNPGPADSFILHMNVMNHSIKERSLTLTPSSLAKNIATIGSLPLFYVHMDPRIQFRILAFKWFLNFKRKRNNPAKPVAQKCFIELWQRPGFLADFCLEYFARICNLIWSRWRYKKNTIKYLNIILKCDRNIINPAF